MERVFCLRVARRFLRVPPLPLKGDEPELPDIFGIIDEPELPDILGNTEPLELVLGKMDELLVPEKMPGDELELEKKLGEERS